ncbi:hypothetical protein K435DRAFT_680604 [Dendrothele bispora CBS 962.96]|uniref:Uncharacterized protein n=1 Tax=Dendrothele bispora (strain CBS 962.96) TaxID=1314807 RepID=A0A4S8LHG4_DENBC|nr:hypothetical protein K435DRAFT_680604 [Dendrothele bispora CBS 962.96]
MAQVGGKGPWLSRMLREWTITFCKNHKDLPTTKYGKSNVSILEDEDLAADIHLHLQSLGKWISANDIVQYVATPEFQARLKTKKQISVRTAQRWMKRMDYRWKAEPKGQYSDGHEREDVVDYRQNKFLPKWRALENMTRWWKPDGSEDGNVQERVFAAGPDGKVVVIWHHDESIFYAHDRCKLRWVHMSETAKPMVKGEGTSLMVGHFVSPDYGWFTRNLKSARTLFRPGKNRDGYQTTEDILQQATVAMDILDADYPDKKHVFTYDNATIHTARPANALSARYMQVKPNKDFLCKVKGSGGESDTFVKMKDGTFKDGTPQKLYYRQNHKKYPGHFKGMRVLIKERRKKGHNLPDPSKLKAQCKGFRCPKGRTDCCCRRVLYCEPDFVNQKSRLEEHCEARGYEVIFFPKYHCELNFIEQCWGYAKRIYRMFPLSSSEEDLEKNLIASLDAVPLVSMRRFATRSSRFGDSYFHGLNGAQAAWANKKYRGHRTIPPDFKAEMDAAFTKNNRS